jgi:hypothetical protein
MSSLLTTAYLMERYGPLLTEEQLGEVLHLAAGTVRNQRVRGELPVRGVKTGAHWVFHAADVAAHVDGLRGLVGRAA